MAYSGRPVRIRTGVPADSPAVSDLYLELQAHHFRLQPHNPRYRVHSERWAEIARAALEDPGDEVLVAETEDGLVGCAVLRYEDKPWGLACQIETLVVTPSWRGRGVGSELMAAGEDAAMRRGALGMRVEVVVENDEGRAFYERRGYQALALRYGKPVEGAGPLPPDPEAGS
ncbi:MAG TPA: GNAT family N-acetyltransferase [Actinomycetota bacterium]|nr:GNAT family N-acetyltransferase [Actinomycetota bacterium]